MAICITSFVFLEYRPNSKNSLVKALTLEIPCKVSSIIVLDSATFSCTCLENRLIYLPKKTAANIIAGMIANINKVSLTEVKERKTIPPIMMRTCLKNSAKSVVKVSCNKDMSEAIRLFNSPTRLFEKKFIGSFMRCA